MLGPGLGWHDREEMISERNVFARTSVSNRPDLAVSVMGDSGKVNDDGQGT